MRVNMPVTGKEYVLRDDHMIVSKTDTRGIITYVNQDFLEVSGFSEEELIGAPHNIVRHPDMPPEAFQDLWDTLAAGMPWTALVKNRCKNGDHYWVVANATPIREGGQVTGYMSVRSKPTPQQIEAAGRIYASIKTGEKTWKVVHGRVEKNTVLGKFNMFKNISIKGRLTFMIGIMSAALLIVGGAGLFGMSKTSDGLNSVYAERAVPMGQIAEIQQRLLTNRLRIAVSLVTPTPEAIRQNTEVIEQNIEEIGNTWKTYTARTLPEEEQRVAERFAEDRKRFVTEGLRPAIAALRENNLPLVNKIVVEKIRPLYEPVDKGIKSLMQLQLDGAKHEHEAADSRFQTIRNTAIALIVLGICIALWLGFSMIRAITRPLGRATEVFNSLAGGRYDNEIVVEHEDEVGKVLNALRSMQTKMGFDVKIGRAHV